MAYIKRTRAANGKTYFTLVEGYWDGYQSKQRVLHKFGAIENADPEFDKKYSQIEQEAEDIKKKIETDRIENPEEQKVSFEVDLNKRRPFGSDKYIAGLIVSSVMEDQLLEYVLLEYIKEHSLPSSVFDLLRYCICRKLIDPFGDDANAVDIQQYYGEYHIQPGDTELLKQHAGGMLDKMGQATYTYKMSERLPKRLSCMIIDVDYSIDTSLMHDDTKINDLKFESQLRKLAFLSTENGLYFRVFEFPYTESYINIFETVWESVAHLKQKITFVADSDAYTDENLRWIKDHKFDYVFKDVVRESDRLHAVEGWQYNSTLTVGVARVPTERKRITRIASWNEVEANQIKRLRFGKIVYEKGTINPAGYEFSPGKTDGVLRRWTVKDKKTAEEFELNPFVNMPLDWFATNEFRDGISIVETSRPDADAIQILNLVYDGLRNNAAVFGPSNNLIFGESVLEWDRGMIELNTLIAYCATNVARKVASFTSTGLTPLEVGRALRTARVAQQYPGIWRTTCSEDFVKIMKSYGVEWDKLFVKTKDIDRLADFFGNYRKKLSEEQFWRLVNHSSCDISKVMLF